MYCDISGVADIEKCKEDAIDIFEALRRCISEDPFLNDEKGGALPALVADTLDAMLTKYTNDLGIDNLKSIFFFGDNKNNNNNNNNNLMMEILTVFTPANSESAEMKRLSALLRFASALYRRQRYSSKAGFFEDKRRSAFSGFLYFLLSRKQDDNDPTFEKNCFWADLFSCLAAILFRPDCPSAARSGPLFLTSYLDFARVLGDPRVVGEPRNAPMLRSLLGLLGSTQRITRDLLHVLAGPSVLLHPTADSAVKAEVLRILRHQKCFWSSSSSSGEEDDAAPFSGDALFEVEVRAQSYAFTCQLLKYLTAGPAAGVVGCGSMLALVHRINPVPYTAQASKLRLFRLSLGLMAAALRPQATAEYERVRNNICRNERVGYVITDILRSNGGNGNGTAPAVETKKCTLAALRLAEAIVRAGYGAERHMREALAHDVLLPLLHVPTPLAGRAAVVQSEISLAAVKLLKLGIAAAAAASQDGADIPWGTPAALEAVLSEALRVLSARGGGGGEGREEDPRLVNEVVKLVVRACARTPGKVCADLRARILSLVVDILGEQGSGDSVISRSLTKNALRLVLLELRNGVPNNLDADFATGLAKFDATAPFKTAVLLLNTALICDALRGEAGVLRVLALFDRTLGALPTAQATPKYLDNLAALVLFMLEVSGSRSVPCDTRISLALLAHATRILGCSCGAPVLRKFSLGILCPILAYVHSNRKTAAVAPGNGSAQRYLASFEEELDLVNTLFRTLSKLLPEEEQSKSEVPLSFNGGNEGSNDGHGTNSGILHALYGVLKLNRAYYLNEAYAASSFSFFSAAVLRCKSAAFQSAAATLAVLVPMTKTTSDVLLLKAHRILFALLAECPSARLYDIPEFEPFFVLVLESYLKHVKALFLVVNNGSDAAESAAPTFSALSKLLLAIVGLAARAPPSFALSLTKVLAEVLASQAVMDRERALATYYYVNGEDEGDRNIYEDPAAYAHNTALASVVAVAATTAAQCARDARLLAQCHRTLRDSGALPFLRSVLATQAEIAAASVTRLELVRNVAELCATVLAGDAVTPATEPRDRYDAYGRGLAALLATLAENGVFWPSTARTLAAPGSFLPAAEAAFFLAKALLGLYRNAAELCVAAEDMPTLVAFLWRAARACAAWGDRCGVGGGDDMTKLLEAAAMNTVEAALYLLVHHLHSLPMEESAKKKVLELVKAVKSNDDDDSDDDGDGGDGDDMKPESLLSVLQRIAPRSKFDAFSRMVQYLDNPINF